MSYTSELDVCEVTSRGVIVKNPFIKTEPKQCTALSKEDSIRESSVIIEKRVEYEEANRHLPDRVDNQLESAMYFEESLETCDDMATRFEESIESVTLSESSSIEWDCENEESAWKENESEDETEDEETIATFVTAAGQQLALYAVEDSDEIFAVAVYDESDEPPSNFQFLMKADVERLIGEGAVRTVKKPLQMKRRVFTAQPPTFYRKEEVDDETLTCNTSVNSRKNVIQEEDSRIEECNYETYQNYNDINKVNLKSSDSVHTTVDEQSDITYLMMDDSFVNIAEQPHEDNLKFEDELMEHSTVQYILLEADHQSDSELTFEEIQTILQNMKISRKKSLETNDKKFDKSQDDHLSIQQNLHESSLKIESLLNEAGKLESHASPQSTIERTYSVSESDRQQLIDTLTDSPPSTMTTTTSQTPLKIKRSRKQQLISVDRDDGEIIIQPASMINEELIDKKRTNRRRQLSSQIRAMVKRKKIKRPKRRKLSLNDLHVMQLKVAKLGIEALQKVEKNSLNAFIVEVIDLDVDEEEQQTTRNVVEITLDDNKDEYSSDKENEIIMVRDSDSDISDEEEEDGKNEWQSGDHLTKLNGVIRCEYCSKNFRYRRTFNMHLLMCQKSSTKALSLGKRKPKGKANKKVKKQFSCKICSEKFDAVLALARHVRLEHLSKKKNKLSLSSEKSPSKSLRSVQEKETSSTEEEESDDDDNTTERELSMLARVKRKRKQRINYSLDTKKLDCADCGRWFPSSALLNAHSLQHGTKKSEQLHKCHICKKLIKSRLLFLRHLKMHNDKQRNSGSSSRMLRRKLRARPNTRRIASPRKRGRPRKF